MSCFYPPELKVAGSNPAGHTQGGDCQQETTRHFPQRNNPLVTTSSAPAWDWPGLSIFSDKDSDQCPLHSMGATRSAQHPRADLRHAHPSGGATMASAEATQSNPLALTSARERRD